MAENARTPAVAEEALLRLSNRWPMPSRPRPIVVIGSGAIVHETHLPAYRKGDLPVAGVCDVGPERGRGTAERLGVPKVYPRVADALAEPGAVFDLAIPPDHLAEVLSHVPPGSAVLIQKPMGRDLVEARRIRDLCRQRRLTAAIDFQLRYSPLMLALRDALRRDLLGDVLNVEIHLSVFTPWDQFPYLKTLPRLEILVHSVHYLDWVRAVLGEPRGVYARTIPHPDFPDLKSTRTAAILNYGERVRCVLSINHNYRFGPEHEEATVRVEGTRGAAVGSLGEMLNYPHGEPDTLEVVTEGTGWVDVPLEGNWFPDAFLGSMANLQRFAAGEDRVLLTSVEDSYRTMALVEACYESDSTGGTPLPE